MKISFLIFFIFLTGCSKPDSNQNELSTLKAKVSDLELQVSTLKAQLADVNSKVLDIDAQIYQVKTKAKGETGSNDGLDINALNKAISTCVQKVRSTAPSDEVYSKFDAYYNSASGKVFNNNQYVSQEAVYAFNKCMQSSGFPLK